MKSIQDVFDCWGSIPELAAAIGESHWTVGKWRQRKSIPSKYWSALVEAAKAKGKNLSADDLAAIHSGSDSAVA